MSEVEVESLTFRGEDIIAAANELNKVQSQHLLISPIFSTRKFYAGTGLDNSGIPNARQSPHDVIRKNIYFLARQTKNIVVVVIQFTQRGLFTLDEKDDILDVEQELICAVAFYSLLIRQQPSIFEKALEILRNHENSHIAELLTSKENERLPEAVPVPVPIVRRNQTIPPRPPPPQRLLFPAWTCAHCTFENPPGTDNICTLCFKTKGVPTLDESLVDSDDDTAVEVRPCHFCTLDNSIDVEFCVACGNHMGIPAEIILDPQAVDLVTFD